MICIPYQLLLGYQIKDGDMGGACGTNGGEEKCVYGYAWETRWTQIVWKTWEQMGG